MLAAQEIGQQREEGSPMKMLMKLSLAFVLSLLIGAMVDDAQAATRRHSKKKVTRSSVRYGGEALRPKKKLDFDGQSIQSLKGSKYDSLATMGNDGLNGSKHLYSLPANFQSRASDSELEMRYRQ
jgi:hypothetical protein